MAWLTGYAASVHSWFAILVTLVACTESDTARLSAIKAKVCACKTASCAEQEMKLVPQGTLKSTHRVQAIARDMLDCRAKLLAAERPSTDPDADEPAADPATAAPGAAEPPAGSP